MNPDDDEYYKAEVALSSPNEQRCCTCSKMRILSFENVRLFYSLIYFLGVY